MAALFGSTGSRRQKRSREHSGLRFSTEPVVRRGTQSVSISGCAGATGDLWDGLQAAANAALGTSAGARGGNDASMFAPESQQSDMEVDASMLSPRQGGAVSSGGAEAAWSAGLAAWDVSRGVAHPQPHGLTSLAAVRCTNMRTCHIGLARSGDPTCQGAHRVTFVWPGHRHVHAASCSESFRRSVFALCSAAGVDDVILIARRRTACMLCSERSCWGVTGAWREVPCLLRGLRSLRLALSDVRELALALPGLTSLDMNGCAGLASLELRCPGLLHGLFQSVGR